MFRHMVIARLPPCSFPHFVLSYYYFWIDIEHFLLLISFDIFLSFQCLLLRLRNRRRWFSATWRSWQLHSMRWTYLACVFLLSPVLKRFPFFFIKSCLYVPPTPIGLHHLHGPAVQPVGVRDCVHGGWRPGRRAWRRGQIHQVRTHAAHALHAGDVQQRHKGTQVKMYQRAIITHSLIPSQHNQKDTAHFPVKTRNQEIPACRRCYYDWQSSSPLTDGHSHPLLVTPQLKSVVSRWIVISSYWSAPAGRQSAVSLLQDNLRREDGHAAQRQDGNLQCWSVAAGTLGLRHHPDRLHHPTGNTGGFLRAATR